MSVFSSFPVACFAPFLMIASAFADPGKSAVTYTVTHEATYDGSARVSSPDMNLRWKLPIHRVDEGKEIILSFDIDSTCRLSGEIDLKERLLRFDVFPSTGHAEILIGNIPYNVDAEMVLYMPPHCGYKNAVIKVQEVISTPELKNAPCIVVRDDQFTNRATDHPRRLIPTIEPILLGPNAGENLLTYTMIFTDEDSKISKSDVEEQMTRYGRATDIEGVSQVRLLKNGVKTSGKATTYQGGFAWKSDCDGFQNPGHSCKTFNGDFVQLTQHPILYNAAENNIFNDEPSKKQLTSKRDMYCLVPSQSVAKSHAREWAMMIDDPSIYKDSDDELRREGKFARKATENLYVLIRGNFKRGFRRSFNVHLTFTSPSGVALNYQKGTIDRLGEGMWNSESFTAIPVPSKALEKLLRGETTAHLDFLGDDIQVEQLRFYRLIEVGTTYISEDISQKLSRHGFCRLNGIQTYCDF